MCYVKSAIIIEFEHHQDQAEPLRRELLDEVKTLSPQYPYLSPNCWLEILALALFKVVWFSIQTHIGLMEIKLGLVQFR